METKVVVVKSEDGEDDVDDRPRTPIITGPIIELRGREVLFAISVFFLTAIVVGLIVVLASNKVSITASAPSCLAVLFDCYLTLHVLLLLERNK